MAHARIARLDTGAAKAAPGVLLVLTAAELDAAIPCLIPIKNRDGSNRADPKHPILCRDEVNHVGDNVAFVVAETRAQAKDAAELIEVEYEELPAVADTAKALAAGAAQVHPEALGNVAFDWHYGDEAAVQAAFGKAARVVEARARQQPRDLQRDGAARLRRRMGRGRRQADGPHLHPGRLGPPRRPVGEPRAAAGEGAGDHARCRRRVRDEVVLLPRIHDGGLRRPCAEPAGEVDRRARRKLPLRHDGP